jgi:hypothetical protein
MRKGYDVRTSEYEFLHRFADFVADNSTRFDGMLSDDERVCGEWMIKTHSLFYKMPHEPFVVFDIIQGLEKPVRPGYAEIIARCEDYRFTMRALPSVLKKHSASLVTAITVACCHRKELSTATNETGLLRCPRNMFQTSAWAATLWTTKTRTMNGKKNQEIPGKMP